MRGAGAGILRQRQKEIGGEEQHGHEQDALVQQTGEADQPACQHRQLAYCFWITGLGLG